MISLFDTGNPAQEINLPDLLKIEDCPELLALCCSSTSIPVWSVLRVAFFRQIMGDLLFSTGSLKPPGQPRSLRDAVVLGRALLHNASDAAGQRLRADVLISTDSIGDTIRDGRWFNRYADPFGDLPSHQAVVLTDLYNWQIHVPRHNDRVVYHAPIQVRAAMIGQFPRQEARELALAATRLVCKRAERLIGWRMSKSREGAFAQWAAGKIAALPFRYSAYRRLLRRVRPKLLLSLAGCYGAHAPLIAAARDVGTVTGEFQHGSISAGHDAYNFAETICASEQYRRTLPQYLLTYGSWWSEQISAPVDCVAIGNPIRAEKVAAIADTGPDRRTILVLSDGIKFDQFLHLAGEIAQAVTSAGLNVVLRPHPLERRSVLDRFGKRVGNINIDTAPDIYATLARAHTIVSEVSTGLFEAAGLVERIVLLDTARARFAFPEHPFAVAGNARQVIGWICGPTPPTPKVEDAAIWAPDWHRNYAWFLRDKVGIDAVEVAR